MTELHIALTPANHPDAVQLIQELDDHLRALYPPSSNHLLSIEQLLQPNIRFLMATREGRAVGCGALRLEPDYAEIKRMYVRPDQRGLGVGWRLLTQLEAIGQAEGYTLFRLETGIYQPEALKLYERLGYQRCPPFGEYTPDPLTLCYEKTL